jgi:hypothetical protein
MLGEMASVKDFMAACSNVLIDVTGESANEASDMPKGWA